MVISEPPGSTRTNLMTENNSESDLDEPIPLPYETNAREENCLR